MSEANPTTILPDGTSPRRPPHGPTGVRAHLSKTPDSEDDSFFCWCDHCGTEGELAVNLADDLPPTCPNCGRPVGVTVEQQISIHVILDPPVLPGDVRRFLAATQRQAFNLLKHHPGACPVCVLMLCECSEGPMPEEELPEPENDWDEMARRFNDSLYALGMPELNPCRRCGGCGGHPNVVPRREED